MKRYIFPGIFAILLFGVIVHGCILEYKCAGLRQELIRQEMTLLKQTEILAVNTAILKGVFAVEKTRNPEPEKEVFKIDHMP